MCLLFLDLDPVRRYHDGRLTAGVHEALEFHGRPQPGRGLGAVRLVHILAKLLPAACAHYSRTYRLRVSSLLHLHVRQVSTMRVCFHQK